MVEKSSFRSAVDKLRSLPWRDLFYMFYIEPVVVMLIFAHMLSGEYKHTLKYFDNKALVFDRRCDAQSDHISDMQSNFQLQ